MQHSFIFSYDHVPTHETLDPDPGSDPSTFAVQNAPVSVAQDNIVAVRRDGALLKESDPGSNSLEPVVQEKLYYDTKAMDTPVKFASIDLDKTLFLERGHNGFKFVPMSRIAGTKLLLIERRFEQGDSNRLNKALSYTVLCNLGMSIDHRHPLVSMLSQYGLNLVLSQQALTTYRNIQKNFKRLMTPFKFHVPLQFKDLQGTEDDYVKGPFVEDVYSSEITRYTKKMEELGLTNLDADFHLHPYQSDDVAQLAVKRYAFVNHDMGLGKTLMASALIQMHGYERVLVIAPGAVIGSYKSGWRHELNRMGIPEDHIHIINGPEDLPNEELEPKKTKSFRPFQNKPHVYLIDYSTLAKDKWEWANYSCTECGLPVTSDKEGKCKAHKRKQTLTTCPVCYASAVSRNKLDEEEENIEANWTGRYCKLCTFQVKKRVLNKGRTALAQRLMGNLLKRQKFGKAKFLTDEQHKEIDDIPLHEKVTQSSAIATPEQKYQIDMLLSPKPVWKHIYPGMFKFLLMDESHMVKDNTTRRGQAVQMIRGLKRVYVMTGTMLTNYVSDSFWQLQRLLPGGFFPVNRQLLDFNAHKGMKLGEETFLNRFEGRSRRRTGFKRISTIAKPDEFWGLMSRVQLRRHDEDVEVNGQVNLPELKLHTEYIEMDPYHKDLYRMKTGEFQRDILEKIKKAKGNEYAATVNVNDLAPLSPADLRTKLQDLRQIAACPDQTGIYQNKDETVKITTKDARILELVSDAISRKEKTVVFCSWIAQITRLKMLLDEQKIPTMVIDGGVTKEKKWLKIDEWRGEPTSMVLLASIDSMGQAVNLTSILPEEFKCCQVIFGSPEWSPNKMEQAWCRVHRIGQTEDTRVFFLYHKDTIEEEMDALLYQKRQTIAKAQDRVEINRDDTQVILTYQEIATRILNKINKVQ